MYTCVLIVELISWVIQSHTTVSWWAGLYVAATPSKVAPLGTFHMSWGRDMAADISTSPAAALFKPSWKSGLAAGATAAAVGAVTSDRWTVSTRRRGSCWVLCMSTILCACSSTAFRAQVRCTIWSWFRLMPLRPGLRRPAESVQNSWNNIKKNKSIDVSIDGIG